MAVLAIVTILDHCVNSNSIDCLPQDRAIMSHSAVDVVSQFGQLYEYGVRIAEWKYPPLQQHPLSQR